jgi:hypothetical protein
MATGPTSAWTLWRPADVKNFAAADGRVIDRIGDPSDTNFDGLGHMIRVFVRPPSDPLKSEKFSRGLFLDDFR